MSIRRRKVLKWLLATGVFSNGVIGYTRYLLAGSGKPILQGVNRMEAGVTINGSPAEVGTPVSPGDQVSTNTTGQAMLVIGEDAFLIRANSNITLGDSTDSFVKVARLDRGGILSVFGRGLGTRTLTTSSATIGVRGTGLYVMADDDITYVCTCYGQVTITPNANPEKAQTLVTRHHDEPRYIYSNRTEEPMVRAPVIDHSDAELYMLEGLVKRRPPFDDYGGPNGGGY